MHNSYRNNTGVLKVITSKIKSLKGFAGKFGKTNIWKASFLLGVTCLDKGFDLTWFAAIYLSIYDKLHITRTPQQVLQNLSCIKFKLPFQSWEWIFSLFGPHLLSARIDPVENTTLINLSGNNWSQIVLKHTKLFNLDETLSSITLSVHYKFCYLWDQKWGMN